MDFTSGASGASGASGLVNVNGSNDPCYRYKMHLLATKYIAKNGGTTIIENAEQVARDIYRDLSDLKSCMAKGIGGRVQIEGNTLAVQGRWTQEELQQLLTRYIQAHVLCSKCGNPETVLVKKKRRCQACGHCQQ